MQIWFNLVHPQKTDGSLSEKVRAAETRGNARELAPMGWGWGAGHAKRHAIMTNRDLSWLDTTTTTYHQPPWNSFASTLEQLRQPPAPTDPVYDSDVGSSTNGRGLIGVFQELQKRTEHYRHTAKGLVSVLEVGLAEFGAATISKVEDDDQSPRALLQITPRCATNAKEPFHFTKDHIACTAPHSRLPKKPQAVLLIWHSGI